MAGDATPTEEGRASARLFEWVTEFEPDARQSFTTTYRLPLVVFGLAAALGGVIVLVAALWPVGGGAS